MLDELRARYPDASHHCWAWVLRKANAARYSDDGEPSGTAGMPMLEVLRRRGLYDVAIVVTRYFGGTLLGAGGLVRAYTQTAVLALDAAGVVEMRPCTVFTLTLPYPLYGKVLSLLPGFAAERLDDSFAEMVRLTLRTPTARLEGLSRRLSEISAGEVKPEVLREEYARVE